MAFTQITCTGQVTYDGKPVVAEVHATLSTPITNGTTVSGEFKAVCNTAGNFALTLPANDDGGTTPSGSYYAISVRYGVAGLGSGVLQQFAVIVPKSTAPSIDLFSLSPPFVPPSSGVQGAALLLTTHQP